jgi:D-hexose-6-phosphate mutarotase
MKEHLINSVAEILQVWNPLGEKMSSMSDLEGYRYEAMDIISTVSIAKKPVRDAVALVLLQAFNVELDSEALTHFSAHIERAIAEG